MLKYCFWTTVYTNIFFFLSFTWLALCHLELHSLVFTISFSILHKKWCQTLLKSVKACFNNHKTTIRHVRCWYWPALRLSVYMYSFVATKIIILIISFSTLHKHWCQALLKGVKACFNVHKTTIRHVTCWYWPALQLSVYMYSFVDTNIFRHSPMAIYDSWSINCRIIIFKPLLLEASHTLN